MDTETDIWEGVKIVALQFFIFMIIIIIPFSRASSIVLGNFDQGIKC